nr:hypothetical protein BaRGS_024613 [Batillaria attramentaria]
MALAGAAVGLQHDEDLREMLQDDSDNLVFRDPTDTVMDAQKITLLTILTTSNVLMLFGNGMSIYIILQSHSLQKHTYYWLVLNLAVLDLLNSLIVVPLNIIWEFHGKWPFDQMLCDFEIFLDTGFSVIAAYSTVLLSLDKYLYITKPFFYHHYIGQKMTVGSIVVTWKEQLHKMGHGRNQKTGHRAATENTPEGKGGDASDGDYMYTEDDDEEGDNLDGNEEEEKGYDEDKGFTEHYYDNEDVNDYGDEDGENDNVNKNDNQDDVTGETVPAGEDKGSPDMRKLTNSANENSDADDTNNNEDDSDEDYDWDDDGDYDEYQDDEEGAASPPTMTSDMNNEEQNKGDPANVKKDGVLGGSENLPDVAAPYGNTGDEDDNYKFNDEDMPWMAGKPAVDFDDDDDWYYDPEAAGKTTKSSTESRGVIADTSTKTTKQPTNEEKEKSPSTQIGAPEFKEGVISIEEARTRKPLQAPKGTIVLYTVLIVIFIAGIVVFSIWKNPFKGMEHKIMIKA